MHPRRFLLTIALLLSVTTLVGASAWWLQRPAAAAVDAGPRTITVMGQGEVLARPDMANAYFGVDAQGTTSHEAMTRAGEAMTKVLAAIKGAGIAEDDITTTNISLYPEYSRSQPPTVVGYRASNTVTVRVRDLNKLVWVLDGAVAAGATYTSGISFGFNNDDDLRNRALRATARNARAKADAIADAMGVTVTTVHAVAENGVSVPGPFPVKAPDQAAPATPIQPGTQTVTGNVTAAFIIG